MFLSGSYTFTLDPKGRISIPAKLRKNLDLEADNRFYITRGVEKCIYLYHGDAWKNFEKKLSELDPFDPDNMNLIRMILMDTHDDFIDKQNRLLIPKSLLKYAEIEKDVFILGAVDKIELWNPEIYSQLIQPVVSQFSDMAHRILRKGKNA